MRCSPLICLATVSAVTLMFLCSACNSSGEDASSEPQHGEHDDHGHDENSVSVTHFTQQTELFAEYAPLSVGERSEWAAHVTVLDGYRALNQGEVTIQLEGGKGPTELFSAGPASPGIFRIDVTPEHSGKRYLSVAIQAEEINAVHDLGVVMVTASDPDHGHEHAHGNDPHGEHGHAEAISFLKEQQWRMDFAVARATNRRVRPAFEAYGEIVARPDGASHITAPVAGRVVAGERFPRLGARVEVGDTLLSLTPRLSDMGDDAALDQAAAQARIDLNLAVSERKRLEKLFEAGAVPERRLIEARSREASARSALTAARRRQGQVSDAEATDKKATGIEVRAPLSGTIVEIDVAGGQFVEAGQELMHVIDLDPVWLKVHVSETHAHRLEDVEGAWFSLEGFHEPTDIGPDQVVTISSVVEHESRTIPLYFRVPNPDGRIRVGMFAEVHVISDQPREAVTVPISAVIYEAGVPVVYVQRGGESFERRTVRVGERDGEYVEIEEGLLPGEMVVSEGAYAVRLASAGGSVPEHGHSH